MTAHRFNKEIAGDRSRIVQIIGRCHLTCCEAAEWGKGV